MSRMAVSEIPRIRLGRRRIVTRPEYEHCADTCGTGRSPNPDKVSPKRSGSVLTCPGPTEVAGNAIGQELPQTGAKINRRSQNIQSTIKVPAGYKFILQVNRDVIFEGPHEPVFGDVPVTGEPRKREI